MRLKSLVLQNFKLFQKATLADIPDFAVLVGKNGAGKSTLLDAFAFLQDCLRENVCAALDRRGGFHEVVSRGHDKEHIVLELRCRLPLHGTERMATYRMVTYRLEVACQDKRPFVAREVLRYRNGARGPLLAELDFARGQGKAQTPALAGGEGQRDEEHVLAASDVLALKEIGQDPRFCAAHALCQAMESWHFADICPGTLCGSRKAQGAATCLSPRGDNLVLVVRYLQENRPGTWEEVLWTMRSRIPGLADIQVREREDGRIELLFVHSTFAQPIADTAAGVGTMQLLAWLVLLHSSQGAYPLVCAETPEQQLDPHFLGELADWFRCCAARGKGQMLATSQSSDFLDALKVDKVYWLERDSSGFGKIVRARDDSQVTIYMEHGDTMGALWMQGFFGDMTQQRPQETEREVE